MRKYTFTPDLLQELRLAYCGSKREISANLDRLVRRTGWPRHAFKTEAIRRGWTTADHQRNWRPAELDYLRHGAESTPAAVLARRLGRSSEAVRAKLREIRNLEAVSRHGYDVAALGHLFGVQEPKVLRWLDRGLFGVRLAAGIGAVPQTAVRRFIQQHPHEYDLARVEQAHFKSLVFGGGEGF